MDILKNFALAIIGLFFAYILSRWLNNLFTFMCSIGAVNLRSYGKWAVVTGCTDGIGRAYVEEFAKRGMSLVLISRSLEKLTQQSIQLMKQYPGVQTRIIAVDFTNSPQIVYPQIENSLVDLIDIGVLVNNVGMGHFAQYFHEYAASSDHAIEDLIACNVLPCTKMTAIILPKMLNRHKGLIINVSSSLGRFTTPLMTAYAASKAYVDFFSRCLMAEYSSKGIRVQSLCPFFVSTKMTNISPKFWSPTPKKFVHNALKTIRTQSISCGYLVHNIQCWYAEYIFPNWLIKILAFIFARIGRKLYFPDFDGKI